MVVSDLDGRKGDVDFVGVKVGDINNSVDPTALHPTIQTRSNETCDFDLQKKEGLIDIKFDRSVVIGDIILDLDLIGLLGFQHHQNDVWFPLYLDMFHALCQLLG